jgi:hypothetical protein
MGCRNSTCGGTEAERPLGPGGETPTEISLAYLLLLFRQGLSRPRLRAVGAAYGLRGPTGPHAKPPQPRRGPASARRWTSATYT